MLKVFISSFIVVLATASCRTRSPRTYGSADAKSLAGCEAQGLSFSPQFGRCMHPSLLCDLRRDGSVWDGSKCLSPRSQCLAKEAAGHLWSNGKCLSPAKSCQLLKGRWNDAASRCESARLECKSRDYFEIDSQGVCRPLSFARLCQLAAAEESERELSKSFARLVAVYSAKQKQLDSAPPKCKSLASWIHQQKRLDLASYDDRKIIEIAPLRSLSRLQELYLDNNAVATLKPLRELNELRVLSLVANAIHDLSPLAALVNLEELFLDKNKISELGPLASLSKLTRLSLWENRVSNLAPLAKLRSLETLELKNNLITDVSPLRNLRTLTSVSLEANRIDLKGAKNSFNCPTVNVEAPAIAAYCSRRD